MYKRAIAMAGILASGFVAPVYAGCISGRVTALSVAHAG